jgi:hypothetical protein
MEVAGCDGARAALTIEALVNKAQALASEGERQSALLVLARLRLGSVAHRGTFESGSRGVGTGAGLRLARGDERACGDERT